MDIFQKLGVEPAKAVKFAGIAVAGLILLLFVHSFFFGGHMFGQMGFSGNPTLSIAPTMGYGGGTTGSSYGGMPGADYDYSYAKGEAAMMPELSARNVASMIYPQPPQTQTMGDNAEEFEITQYSAQIETRKLSQTCGAFAELKKRTDVIFENSNTGDHNCSFTFKVKHASVEEVLAWLKALGPKELSENTQTIKNQIDDYTSETEILTKKRASIDETLTKALAAYDEISRLATNTQNADALAKIINSKIDLIQRLTQERININEQLDRYARAKSEQLDKLDYTYFYVSVYENKFLDLEQIGDSWKQAVRDFFLKFNQILQGLTINLILIALMVVQWLIYGVIALFVAKYAWKFAKYVWNKE